MVVPNPNRCRLGRSCASYDLTWPHYPHVSALVLPSFKCVTFALFGGRHMRDPRVQQQGNVFSAPPEVGRAGAGPISPVLQLFIFVDLASSTSCLSTDVTASAARRHLHRTRYGRPPLRPGPPEPLRLESAAAERGAFCVRGIPETRSCNFHGRRLHGAADARCSDVCRSVVCRSAARSAASSSLAALLELEAELHERRRLLISTAHPRAAAALKGASCISRHQACSSCTRGPLRGIRAARSKVEAHSFI